MKHITIESYPNREIRVTLTPAPSPRNRNILEDGYDPEKEKEPPSPTCHSRKTRKAPKKPQKQGHSVGSDNPGYGGLPRNQRFSTYARRQILRAGGALERVANHEDCLFLTLTLPGSTKEAMAALACYSAFSVHRLKAWINYHVPSKFDLYTWEWQKRGALHLHYVVWCPNRETGEYIKKNLKQQWIRILDAISEASKVDIYKKNSGFSWASNKEATRVDAQWCKKSVAAYLSKYVSKPNKFQYSHNQHNFCPSRWYGVSRPLLAKLRELSFKVSLDSLRSRDAWTMYEDCLSVLQSWGIKCYEYEHKVVNGRTTVSYCNANEQDSIWTTIMNQICPTPDFSLNIEQNMKRLARNGCILLKKHPTWLKEFNYYYGKSRPANLLNLPSYKDMSKSDLVFLVDALAYSLRSHQRTRFELPGECKLWYSQMKRLIDTAPSEDLEWIGALKL